MKSIQLNTFITIIHCRWGQSDAARQDDMHIHWRRHLPPANTHSLLDSTSTPPPPPENPTTSPSSTGSDQHSRDADPIEPNVNCCKWRFVVFPQGFCYGRWNNWRKFMPHLIENRFVFQYMYIYLYVGISANGTMPVPYSQLNLLRSIRINVVINVVL